MNRIIISIFAMSLFASAQAAPEPAPTQPKPRTISVSGCAVGYVQPGAVLWTASRESAGRNLLEAKETSEQQMKIFVDALTKKGIQGSDVALGMIKIQDTQSGQEVPQADNPKRFSVSRTITFRQRELPLFHDILDFLSKSKGQAKYSMYCSRTDKITRDTLVRATQAAKDKASAMATVLGATLGPVLSINEYAPSNTVIKEENVIVDESTPVLATDAEKVRITVFVTFELL